MESTSKERLGYISAWAYALGCAVGWGSFMNPTNLFLPNAGPLGSLIGIVLATAMMILIGTSISYMAKKYPAYSGIHVYVGNVMGADHGGYTVKSGTSVNGSVSHLRTCTTAT